ncbi:MAG: hypothetical protein HY205_02110 [Nitrospirae bacterium]|nr:hypothetical protein [Nitrospirota bacterium]
MHRPMKQARQHGILPYQHVKQLIADRVIQADVPIEDRRGQSMTLALSLPILCGTGDN